MARTLGLGLEWQDLRNTQKFVELDCLCPAPYIDSCLLLQGFGSKVLKKSGWREGSGVGASSQGISEPLEAEGQHPHSKKGLGYGQNL